jgi:hypothetical protein
METSKTDLERYMKKCLEVQKKMFELAKNGSLTQDIYFSLMQQDEMYGSLIKKEKGIED